MADDLTKSMGRGVEVLEDARGSSLADGFFSSIFYGHPKFKFAFPWPKQAREDIEKTQKVIKDQTDLLLNEVDPYLIDDVGSIPEQVFEHMSHLGLYAMKVPEKYGGLGLSQKGYSDVLSLAASWSSAIVIVQSADNTIGCKFPVMYYGTDEQKDKFLPELSKWPTGFCLTEKDVGSDASKIRTYAVRARNNQGKIEGYRITGQKWFTTNGILHDGTTLARYLAVVARIVEDPNPNIDSEEFLDNKCFGLFIVPTDSEGFDIGTRNTFVGMRGIHNSNPTFNDVYVPVFNLIGNRIAKMETERGWGPREGSGLQIAYQSLYGGRISIAKGCTAVSKQALNIIRWWAGKRDQLGGTLDTHEDVRNKILEAGAKIMAMEAITDYASLTFDKGFDVRVEAAAAKILAAEYTWQIVDDMMQVRGGRGYEIWQSLCKRELTPPDDALWTGSRPNRIFEGANDILTQFVFREGAGKYIELAKKLRKKNATAADKLLVYSGFAGSYTGSHVIHNDIPELEDPELAKFIKYVDDSSRLLTRNLILTMRKFQEKLIKRQLMINRFARININLGSMALICFVASPTNKDLAKVYCRMIKKETDLIFKEIKNNDDEFRDNVAGRLLEGEFDDLLLSNIIPMTEEHMKGPKDNS